ncbi:MAG TPA: COX15/CtaA family protein [Sphingobacteriaceae bacterium]|nr:COX15/CtaA family protein [Sphingobacteriaceae bacterium]
MYSASEKKFLTINLIAIITLFALILAGGIVRSSGSGMGCPDWPKCFDKFIPPTNSSQLPPNYQQKYVEGRVMKNERFARTLDLFGYGKMANQIRSDKSILKPEEFNAAKTWTEYINRLIGAAYGFVLILCFIFSFAYLRTDKSIFFLSLLNIILVGFQGWMGSIVVSTNLLAWIVTVHMLLAMVILAISIYTYFKAQLLGNRKLIFNRPATMRIVAIFAVLLTLLQIVLGTEVREQIDAVSSAVNHINRSEWVAKTGIEFNYHRDLAGLILLVNVIIFLMLRRSFPRTSYQYKFIVYVLLLLIVQLITGLILSYYSLPPIAQAIHILLATLLFGAQFYLFLILKRNNLDHTQIRLG